MSTNPFLAAARAGLNDLWRYILTVLLSVGLLLVGSGCLSLALLALSKNGDIYSLPPALLYGVLLAPFGLLILGLWIGLRLLHHRPFSSVIRPEGRFRWGSFFLSGGVWLALAAGGDLVVSRFLPETYHFSFTPATFWPYALVILLFIPVQVLAEETYFRGYLAQGFGLAWGSIAAWLIPSIIFGLLHGWNPEVGTYGILFTLPIYLGIGLVLGWITLRSGGLELALGLHIANNLYGALFVASTVSALSGPTLFKQDYNAPLGLVVFIVAVLIYLTVIIGIGRRSFLRGATNLLAVLVLLLPLVLTACAPGANPRETVADRSTIPLSDCWLKAPGQAQIKALCGKLSVAEDPAKPDGVKIDLNIAVVHAVSRTPAADPIVLLAGGPGQAATQSFLTEILSIERLRFKRDLVLVDQRGTGSSHPLNCFDAPEANEVYGVEVSPEKQLAELDQCRAVLKTDPRLYTTEVAMRDLDQVRQALGYETWNLLGVSYGTRAALTYLRLFPEHTRSLILDGVVPPEWPLGAETAPDAQRALDLIIKRCSDDSGCAKAFPGLKDEFNHLRKALAKQPAEITVPHPTSGKPTRVQINPRSLGAAIRLMSYTDKLAALIPLAIHNAARGDYDLLAGQYLLMSAGLEDSLSEGMYYSVVCAEDAPYLPEKPPAGDFYTSADLDLTREACKRWTPDPPALDRTPLKADVPAFLISGSADPVTPPENGELVAKLLPNSIHLVLNGLGHNNFYAGCVPNLLYDFLEAASPEGIDSSCTQLIHPLPFFITLSGPVP